MRIVTPEEIAKIAAEDVTVCAPCDQGAAHPESHAEDTRILLADRVPVDVPDEMPVRALAWAVRKTLGPITVHQSPADDLDTASGRIVREWIATQP